MDEIEIKKMIDHYDNIILEKEIQEANNQIKWQKMHNTIRQLPIIEYLYPENRATDEHNAEIFMSERINYLKHYTKTKMKAQKELDFIRKQADKLGFRFQPIASSYAYEFYPAAQDAGLNQKTIHNLLIGISEFAAAQNASSEMLSELLSEIADLLQYGTTPNDTSLKTSEMNINKEVQELVQRGGANKKFYENFASLLHYKYSESALKNIDPIIAEENRRQNKIFDHSAGVKGFVNILNFGISLDSLSESIFTNLRNPKLIIANLLSSFGKIILPFSIASNLIEEYGASDVRKRRYNNGNFTFDKFQADENIFTPEEQDKIYGRIEMFRPYSNLQWKQGPPEGGIQLEYDTNLNYKLNYNDENQSSLTSVSPEQIMVASTDDEIVDTSETKYPETFEDDVKDIIANVFDDFAQLKGFRKRNIT